MVCFIILVLNVIQLIVDIMVAMILAWQRDLHVLHHSHGIIVAKYSLLETQSLLLTCYLSLLMTLSHFLVRT